MNYVIDKNSRESAYLQLYRLIRQDITEGVYPYETKLPSKRTIAQETGLSLITVEHSLELLCEEGYVESRIRSGYYVCFRVRDFITPVQDQAMATGQAKLKNTSCFRAGQTDVESPDNRWPSDEELRHNVSSIPEKQYAASATVTNVEFPFSVLARTMRKVLTDYGEKILVKSPNQGDPRLRMEICSYLKRSRGISVEPSQVIIGAGAEYLYGLIVQLLGSRRIYALENPSYDKIRKVYGALGVDCDMLTMGMDGIKSEELAQTDADVLHVTPFNSYPSGITAGISKKHEYLLWAKERHGYIIEDNYDSELTVSRKPEEPLFTMAGGNNVIYINTFSQTIAPSIRVGYMILPENMLEKFNEVLGFYSCTVSLYEQYVLADLLHSGDFERHINRVRRQRRRELK